MLSSRYLHLHEALALGPMWLQQGARVRPANPQPTVTATTPSDNNTGHPPAANIQAARQAVLAALNTNTPPQITATNTPTTAHISTTTTTNRAALPPLHIDTLADKLLACTRCHLHKQRRQPLPGHGSLNATLLVISPNPAPEDDMAAQLFSGDAGVLLANMLAAAGIQPHNVYHTSLVKCTPNISLQVDEDALAACAAVLQQQIDWIQPKAVLLLGQAFARENPDTLAQQLQQRPYVIVPHPARLLRQSSLKAQAWQALQVLAQHLR